MDKERVNRTQVNCPPCDSRNDGSIVKRSRTHLLELPVWDLLVVNPHELLALPLQRRGYPLLFFLSFPIFFRNLPRFLTHSLQVDRWPDPLRSSRARTIDSRAGGYWVRLTAAWVHVLVVDYRFRVVLRQVRKERGVCWRLFKKNRYVFQIRRWLVVSFI